MRTSGDAAEAIEFHWDCDEYCCDVHGVHVTPALSTVTYLGEVGAPTLVLDVPSPRLANADPDSCHGAISGGALSYPRAGKHLVFDGRLLHGAVPTRTERRAHVEKGSVRVSLLVNVWLNHTPRGVEPLPAALLPQLSRELLGPPGAPALRSLSRTACAGAPASAGRRARRRRHGRRRRCSRWPSAATPTATRCACLPRRREDGDAADDDVDDESTVLLAFEAPVCPWQPAAEVCANDDASLAAAPRRES